MGLGWCAVVPALTDFTFRCIPTNDHPNTGNPEGFDHQDDHCTHDYHQGDQIQQQGKGWGALGGGTCGERAGAGGAREWGAGDMLRAGWGGGEVLIRPLSTPYTQRGTVGVVVSTETTITTHITTSHEGTNRDSEVFFSRTADPLKSSPWGFAMLGCSLVTISLVVLNFCACRTFISSRVVAAPDEVRCLEGTAPKKVLAL